MFTLGECGGVERTREDSTLHVHCSGLPGDRDSCQCNSFAHKMVLKRPFVVDTGKNWLCMFIVQVSWGQSFKSV